MCRPHVPLSCSMWPYTGPCRRKYSRPRNDSGGTCPHQNVLDAPAMCRHHPPRMVSRLAHSVCIARTWFVVEMIALYVLYLKIHHMYLANMYIETAIPKNVYVACVTHRAPHSAPTVSMLAHSVFIIKTWCLVQMKALDVLYQNIHHMYLDIVYI